MSDDTERLCWVSGVLEYTTETGSMCWTRPRHCSLLDFPMCALAVVFPSYGYFEKEPEMHLHTGLGVDSKALDIDPDGTALPTNSNNVSIGYLDIDYCAVARSCCVLARLPL